MAGIVTVFDGKERGTRNIGSRALFLLYDFLIQCKKTSPILAADGKFAPQSDLDGIPGLTDWLNLADQADTTVAEIARLLEEVLPAEHPFWKNYDLLFVRKYLDELREQGKDVDGFIHESIGYFQASFRQVADLIRRRLKRERTKE